jgi:hypothetical protein
MMKLTAARYGRLALAADWHEESNHSQTYSKVFEGLKEGESSEEFTLFCKHSWVWPTVLSPTSNRIFASLVCALQSIY